MGHPVFSDSDFANDIEERQSVSGGLILIAGGPVVFVSRKQNLVGLSSTETEYIAACEAIRELTWIRQFMTELNIAIDVPTLYLDNQSTIRQIRNGDTNKRNKHVDIKYHYVRRALQEKVYNLEYVPTDDQLADYLTKNLNGPRLKLLITKSGIKEVSRKQSTEMGKISLISLSLICLGMASSMSEGIKFQRADPILWSPSNYYVDIGMNLYHIEYTYNNPCDAINIVLGLKMDHSPFRFKQSTVDRFKQLCNDEFIKGWIPKLEEFEKCESASNSWYQHVKKTVKRWVIWFILAAVVVMLVVSAITATTVILDKKINAVNESLAQAQEKIERLTTNFHHQEEINSKTIKATEDLLVKTDKIIGAIHDFANVIPEMLWTGNKIYRYFEDSKAALGSMTEDCKEGRINTKGLAYILNNPEIQKIRKEDTRIEEIRRVNNQTLLIEFLSPSPVEDTKIFRVTSFKYWVNLTTEPEMLEYVGPSFLIHNYTSNCSRGLTQPETDSVYETCQQSNYGDPRLQNWKPLRLEEQDHTTQIMKTRSHTYVYCMFQTINIEGEEHQCPPFVFKLPLLQAFSIGNFSHRVNLLRLNSTMDIESLRVKHQNSSFHDDDFENQLAFIDSIRKLNKKLGDTIREKEENMSIPWASLPFWSWNMVSLLSLIVGIICCILKFTKPKGENHNEYITVVNQPPPPIELSRNYPSLSSLREERKYEEVV